MLAQNFKTAPELGITDAELDALIKVLGMLERGELEHNPEAKAVRVWNDDSESYKFEQVKPNGFNMQFWSGVSACGTVACIRGWAMQIARPLSVFPNPYADAALTELFIPRFAVLTGAFSRITPEHAAIALRSYLTTGEANWAEALSVG